jgi:hypothetical protein
MHVPSVAALVALLLAAGCHAPAAPPAADTPVSARYVEVRSAAVFAGPCHVNGEYDSQGRDAVVGLRVVAGRWQGHDLAGVQLVACVSSPSNLAEAAPRRTTLWLDVGLDPARREAAAGWLAATHGAALGQVELREAAVEVRLDGEAYAIEVPGVCAVQGLLLPNRACCSMPEAVWYGPVLPGARDLVVGHSDACAVTGGPVAWTFQRQNNALAGSLR